MNEKYIFYKGLKFTRDEETGYYLNSTNRIRLHRYVWECANGKIPKGYDIHHIDQDKSNNNLENLELMDKARHLSLHGREKGNKNVKSGWLDKIRPMTKKWHASEEGRKWHREHFENTKDKLFQEKEFVCEQCGKKYTSINNGSNRFCSNACKSAWRRASGIDDEERECIICGKSFKVNKYSKAKCCSRKCAAQFREKNKKN